MKNKIFNFPHRDTWRKDVLIATEQTRFHKKHYYDYYLQKYLIASLYQPKRIAEIGVRWGYSAFSFLCASPTASYAGFDIVGGGHGGANIDTFGYVGKMLAVHYPNAKVDLVYQNTQQLNKMPGKYDFIQVDGNHKEDCVLHDMEIAWDALVPGGVMLIDDDINIAGVTRAVDRFIGAFTKIFDYYYRMPSLTGEVIIRKPPA